MISRELVAVVFLLVPAEILRSGVAVSRLLLSMDTCSIGRLTWFAHT